MPIFALFCFRIIWLYLKNPGILKFEKEVKKIIPNIFAANFVTNHVLSYVLKSLECSVKILSKRNGGKIVKICSELHYFQ